jgi:hypothetical protein
VCSEGDQPKPQGDGSHERMHRDLKAEATQPPSSNLAAQQRRFERWQNTFNHERPHEALGQQVPAEFYQPTHRRLNENDNPLVYPADHEVKLISSSGFLWHEGHNHHVGGIFAGKRVGLRRNEHGQSDLSFAGPDRMQLKQKDSSFRRHAVRRGPPNELPPRVRTDSVPACG